MERWVEISVVVTAVLAFSTIAILLGPLGGPSFPDLHDQGHDQGQPDPATLISGCTASSARAPLLRRYPPGALAPFATSVAEAKGRNRSKESLVEHHRGWIGRIGVNGILDSFEGHDPKCHAVGHEVGRAAVRVNCGLQDLLRACGTRCSTGCFHGVVLGVMLDLPHRTADAMPPRGEGGEKVRVGVGQVLVNGAVVREVCGHPAVLATLGAGECFHAVGHAILVLVDGPASQAAAVEACEALLVGQLPAQHHCGTGVFMETMRTAGWSQSLAPCDKTRLAGACFLYRWRWMGGWRGEDTVAWASRQVPRCAALEGGVRAASCIFGLVAHVGEELIIRGEEGGDPVSHGVRIANTLCESDGVLDVPGGWLACIEGLMLRAAKYFSPAVIRATCESLPGEHTETCQAAAARGMYSMSSAAARYLVRAS